MNMEQGCKAVWSISEDFFWLALPLLRWHPSSTYFKGLSVQETESENSKKKRLSALKTEHALYLIVSH